MERIESEITRQDKTGQQKQREIIGEQKSKEIITHTNVHKNSTMMTDRNNNSNNGNDKRNTRIIMP